MPNEDDLAPLAPLFNVEQFGRLLCKAFGGRGSTWFAEKASESELMWVYVDDPIGVTLEVTVTGHIDPLFGPNPFVLVDLKAGSGDDLPIQVWKRRSARIEKLGEKCVSEGVILGWP